MLIADAQQITEGWALRPGPRPSTSDAEFIAALWDDDMLEASIRTGYCGKPYAEVARELGLSRQRVRARAVKLLRRLRHRRKPSPTP